MKSYKTFFILWLCVPIMAIAHPTDKYKKSKKINKTYNVNSDAVVDIDNSFGDVTITIWDQNTVSIDVYVEVSGNDEETVDDRLESIKVDFNASTSKVSARSKIPNENAGIMSWINGKGKTNTSVDYVIKMPSNGPLDVSNDYGAIIIDKLMAPLKLSCDFGRLEIGQLLNKDNELSFDYTSNSTIDYIKGGTIKADFSKFKLYGAGSINYSGDYTTASFGPTNNLKYNSDFSTLKIENASLIDGRGDYSTIIINKIDKEAILKADFGSITIDELQENFKLLNIKSDYTTVKIGYNRNASFEFECKTEFGSLKLDNSLTIVSSKKEPTESYKQGYHKVTGSARKIEVNSSFGSVTIQPIN